MLIYLFQFLVILGIVLYLNERYKISRLGVLPLLLLFLSSISLALVSAKFAEADAVRYIDDAKLLMSYIAKDPTQLGLFFLSGGNSLYPQYYFPMLIASNTWSNYSSFTIEKFYLLFSYISSPTLLNVSLFFGTLSFVAKLLLLKSGEFLGINKKAYIILWLYLCLGCVDIFFISGIYKECLTFLFLSYLLFFYISPKSKGKWALAIFVFIQLLFLRFDFVLLLFILILLTALYRYIKKMNWRQLFAWGLFIVAIANTLYFSSFKTYIVRRFSRFAIHKVSSTMLDPIDWNGSWGLILVDSFKRWFNLVIFPLFIKSPLPTAFSLFYILSILSLLFFLVNQRKTKLLLPSFLIYFYIVYSIILALSINNYYTQLRYRSVAFIFLMFTMITHFNINKKYM